MPVVRMPVYADSVTVAGTSVVTRISDAVDNHVTGGAHMNVTLAGTVTIGGVARTDWPEGGTPGAITNGMAGPLTISNVGFSQNGSIWSPGSVYGYAVGGSYATIGTSVILDDAADELRVLDYATGQIPIAISVGKIKLGPIISGKQAHTFSDGTNLFFVNVNSVTNAAGSGGETSIIAPLYESGTNVTVTSTQSVYSVAVTGAGPVGIDWSGLALDGTGRAEILLRLNVSEWGGTNVSFASSMTFDTTPEILVTGVWEFACSTVDGVTTRVRQTWPETGAWLRMQGTAGTSGDVVGTWTGVGSVGQTNVTFYLSAYTALCMVRHVASVVANGTSATLWTMPMLQGNTAFDASKCIATNSITDASIGAQFEYRAVVDFGAQGIYDSGPGSGQGVGLWTALTAGNIYLYYTRQESRPLNANERAAYEAGWRP